MKTLLLSLLLSVCIFAQSLTLKEGFVAAHTEMLITSIDPLNTFLKADVSIDQNDILSLRGKFWIQMDKFSSDNKERDEDMHKANRITAFPLATFTLIKLSKNTDGTYTIEGNLEFLGLIKPLQAKAEIHDKDGLVSIKATTKIFADDFGLEMPCILFVCVDEEIDLYVKAVFLK